MTHDLGGKVPPTFRVLGSVRNIVPTEREVLGQAMQRLTGTG